MDTPLSHPLFKYYHPQPLPFPQYITTSLALPQVYQYKPTQLPTHPPLRQSLYFMEKELANLWNGLTLSEAEASTIKVDLEKLITSINALVGRLAVRVCEHLRL